MTKRMMKEDMSGGVIASICHRIAEDGNRGVTKGRQSAEGRKLKAEDKM